jgi:hypothetical protein
MPNPWNRNALNIPNCSHGRGGVGCEALLAGALDMAARTAKALNAQVKKYFLSKYFPSKYFPSKYFPSTYMATAVPAAAAAAAAARLGLTDSHGLSACLAG